MEPIHWILIAVAVALGFGIIMRILNPPKPLDWAEVPEALRAMFESAVPGFTVSEVIHLKGPRKYKMRGNYRGEEMKGEIQYDFTGHAVEIECETPGVGMMKSPEEFQLSDLPAEVVAHMGEIMGEEHKAFAPSRLHTGTFRGEPAFDIRGTTTKWRWEFEFTAAGRLIEMEKTVMAG